MDLPLTKLSETATTITLGWTPIPCLGYVLYADGVRKSNSWEQQKSSWKTAKATEIRVVALGAEATGVWPPAVPPKTYKTRFQNISAQALGDDASFGADFYQQEKVPDRANIMLLNGEKVLRTRCAFGDNNIAGSGTGERCEIMRGGSPGPFASSLSFVEGESFVLGTQFYLDPAFTSPGFLYGTTWMSWNNFVQTHHGSSFGQVPWQLNLCTDSARLGMRVIGGGQAAGPYNTDGTPQGSTVRWYWTLNGTPYIGNNNVWNNGTPGDGVDTYQVPKGVWHKLVMSVKFHQTTGYAKIWINGVQRFNATDIPLGYLNEPGAYFKQGMYRATAANGASPGASGDSILYWRDLYSFTSEAEALNFYA